MEFAVRKQLSYREVSAKEIKGVHELFDEFILKAFACALPGQSAGNIQLRAAPEEKDCGC